MKTIGCSIIFYNDKRQVLLLLRDDIPTIPYPGQWDLPGGSAEEGEQPAEAVAREMKEEMDLDIGTPDFFRVTEFEDRTENTFFMKLNTPETELNQKLAEGQCVQWFSVEQIKQMELAFNFNVVVEAFFLAGKIFSK
jgi:8-oxo-dGTP diphosphatase